jgi:flagellar motility protein MotE (MotC chaperone)
MSADNRLHAFTISPFASDIIESIRVKKKSQFVSEAICHYREWQHTDHTQLRITDFSGVKNIKDINKALEEKERLLQTWVKRANDFQEQLIQLENAVVKTHRSFMFAWLKWFSRSEKKL